jgi:hypothetical protein
MGCRGGNESEDPALWRCEYDDLFGSFSHLINKAILRRSHAC